MKAFLLLVFLSLTSQVAAQADRGSIEGVVTRLDTNEPIRDAQLAVAGLSATTNGQGIFKIDNIPPGTYDVTVSASGYLASEPLPKSSRMEERMMGGCRNNYSFCARFKTTILESRGPRSDSAKVEGVLLDAQNERVGFNRLVLVPEPSRRQNFSLFQIVNADYSGHFSFSSVPPGKYELFAWHGFPDGAWTNALFLEKFKGRGIAVDLTSKDRVLDLRVRLIRSD